MKTLNKWKILLSLGWFLNLQGHALAQEQERPELLDVRTIANDQQETVQLVLKSGSRKFKMICDNVNNLASMLQGLGFPKGHLPRRVKSTSEVTAILSDLDQTEPIYCKGYAARAGENPLNYAIGYYGTDTYLKHATKPGVPLNTVLYKVTNCRGVLQSFSYSRNATSD